MPNDEYVLFSQETIEHYKIDVKQNGFETYESTYDFGSFSYAALDISKLKLDLPLIPSFPVTKSNELLINFTTSIEAPIDDVYELASNLAYRAEWNPGLESLDYTKNRVNRAGELHTCVVNGSTVEFETLRSDKEENHLVYAERTKSAPFTNQLDNFFVFTETATGTNLESSIFVTFKKNRKWMKPLLRRLLKKGLIKGMNELKKFVL
ncbi:MAG: SRPBCC family protein [Flavobacteriales bacterium]|nr:SRPBCC family protein [Flavobacteriales bacterium]MDG1781166.1 SRPBCC family protein [Flavobacteriales bacterium]MDG2245576.1 SRPBCC family protein [Flavobacteriales bacterium]